MLTIRLQRVGKKNQAAFRIVVADKLRAPEKKIVENLGSYNPRTKEFAIKDEARLKYWIEQHVEVSPSAHNLLVEKGKLKADKVKAWRPKVKPAEAAPAAPAAAAPTDAPVETTADLPADEAGASAKAEEPAPTQ